MTTLPRYLAEVQKLFASGDLQRGKIYDVKVKHDDCCPLLMGSGECRCNPDLVIKEILAGEV